MAKPSFDILGIGENTVDTLLRIDQFPSTGSKVACLAAQTLLGGQVATAMIACRRWGLRTHYVGCVGDDPLANAHRREFARERVAFDLFCKPRTPSQASFILVEAQSGERTVISHRDAHLSLPPRFLKKPWIFAVRLLYLDGHDPATTRKAAAWARAHKIPVVADLDHWSPDLTCLLPLVDYPVVSRGLPSAITGERDPLKSLQTLKRTYGCRAVCTTLGVDGALAWDGHRFWYSPSYKVRVADTTGAGDIFHAGFCYGLLRGWESQRTLDFSCAAASLSCQSVGARRGIPTLRKIEDLQRQGQRNRAAFP